jgi:quercetin dioxygenase-like cupin family protein
VHVLEGELRIVFEGDEPRTLMAGDSAYYMSTHPHLFTNASDDEPVRLVCVDTPPNL